LPRNGRWFKVQESVLDNGKLDRAGGEAAMAFIRILALMNRKQSKTGVLEITRAELCEAAKKGRADYALKIFKRLTKERLLKIEALDASSVPSSVPSSLPRSVPRYKASIFNYAFYQGNSEPYTKTKTKTINSNNIGGKELAYDSPEGEAWRSNAESDGNQWLKDHPDFPLAVPWD
jgi:hypothetical protein